MAEAPPGFGTDHSISKNKSTVPQHPEVHPKLEAKHQACSPVLWSLILVVGVDLLEQNLDKGGGGKSNIFHFHPENWVWNPPTSSLFISFYAFWANADFTPRNWWGSWKLFNMTTKKRYQKMPFVEKVGFQPKTWKISGFFFPSHIWQVVKWTADEGCESTEWYSEDVDWLWCHSWFLITKNTVSFSCLTKVYFHVFFLKTTATTSMAFG